MFSRSMTLALAALAAVSEPSRTGKVYGAENIKRVVARARKGKFYGNTSRYSPHQGKQEIARRLAQAKRNEVRQQERAALKGPMHWQYGLKVPAERVSCRGRVI